MKNYNLMKAFIAALLLFVPAVAIALDAPHTDVVTGYTISCSNCHWVHGSVQPPWAAVPYPDAADDNINNRRCFACHNSVDAPIEKTHSTSSTSAKFWTTTGWTTQCVTCHDPHKQNQTQVWGIDTYKLQGTLNAANIVPGVGETTITLNNTPTADYSGYYIILDTNAASAGLPTLFYKIKVAASGSSTLTVKGIVETAYLSAATTNYAIVYGKNVKALISYVNPGGEPKGGNVKLFSADGSFSAGDSINSTTSVCFVCHTQGKFWSSKVGSDLTHNDKADCTTCHAHTGGFKASCGGCHGNPPTVNAATSPNGLVWTTTTGSTTAGAHNAHVTTDRIACDSCHYNSVGTGATHDSRKVTIGFGGFNINTQGGTYGGQAGVAYEPTVTSPVTQVPSGAAKTCANVYCHGATMASNGGTNTSPVWDSAASGACGTCHGTSSTSAPTLGSHTTHASSTGYSFACDRCHPNVPAGDGLHVNGDVAWSFNATDSRTNGALYKGFTTSSTAARAPSVSYGSCTNLYCHSTGTTTPTYQTPAPTWGNNGVTGDGTCGKCHGVLDATPPASGPHTKHVGTAAGLQFACSKCHDSVVNSTANSTTAATIKDKTLHVNGAKNVAFDATNTGGSYNGTNCDNIYCHSQGTGGISGDGRSVTMPATLPTWSGSTNCGSCHGADATGRPAYASGTLKANSHTLATHSQKTCDVCHNPTTTTGNTITNTANHDNKIYNVGGSGTVPSIMTYAYSAAGGSCSNSYCHGTAPIQWGASGTLTCSSCHTSMGAGGTAAYTGKHQTHVNTAGYDFSCEMCHSQNNGTSHVNGEVVANTQSAQVTFNNSGTGAFATGLTYNGSTSTYKARSLTNNPYASEGAISPAYSSTGTAVADGGLHYRDAGTCSNMWCHSNANPAGGINSFSTPAWNGSMTCGSCHKTQDTAANMQNATVTPKPMSASHVKHIATDQYGANTNFTCNSCHNNTASNNATISNTANHVNATKDVAFNAWVGGTACNNTYCHSNGAGANTAAPVWNNTASAACGTCHGADAATPPSSASHAKHVGVGSIGLVYQFSCKKCHNVTVDATAADSTTKPGIASMTAHVNKVKDVDLNTADTLVGASATDNGTGSCSNVYCHSTGKDVVVPTAQLPAAYGGSHYSTVTWGDALTCASCHGKTQSGYPDYTMANQSLDKGTARANSHQSGTHRLTTCNACHNETTTDGSTIASNQHVNGAIRVVFDATRGGASATYNGDRSCSNVSCHGASSPQWGAAGDCTTCHEAGLNNISGVHYKHWSTLAGNATARLTGNASQPGYYQFQCNTCHAIGTHPTGASGLNFADVGFNITWATGNTGGNYAQGTGNTTDTRGQKISVNGSCTNIYCHSSGSAPSTLGGNSAPTYKTVAWSDTSTGCNFCHNAPPATNAHATHATTYSFGCAECHQATVSDNTTIADRSKHVNFINDLQWKSNGFNKGGDAYETAAANTCSNIYCHSQGRANVAPYNAANVVATWTSVGGLGTQCAGCHNGGTTMASGKHSNHVNNSATMGANFTCDKCHSATATNNTTVNVAAGNHVNKKVNVKFDNAINPDTDTPKYNNIATNVAGGAAVDPGSTGYACTNVYCHSQGNRSVAGNFNTVAWTDAAWSATCNGCHGKSNGAGAPDYATGLAGSATANSHGKHAVTYTINCSECHWNTTQNGTTIVTGAATHINGSSSSDVVAGASGKSPSLAYTPGTTFKNCTNAYCHSNANPAGGSNSYSVAQWGNNNNLTCGSCHKTQDTAANMQNATVTPKPMSASHVKHIATDQYGANTNFTCNSCHNNTASNNATISNTANHVNATKDVAFNAWVGGTACNNTYCHSNGAGANTAAPVWNNTASAACGTCHGADAATPPSSASHAKHVGVGSIGLVYQFSCKKCHNVTVDATAADSTTKPGIASMTAHVNKVKDVDLNTADTLVGASATDNGTGSCSNVYCHSTGKDVVVPTAQLPAAYGGSHYSTVTWGDALTCASCHGKTQSGYPDYTMANQSLDKGTARANSHQSGTHRLTTCNACHNETTTDGSTIASNQHVNGAIRVVFDATRGGASATYNGDRSCSNVSCHGASSPQWGAAGDCTTCHEAGLNNISGVHYKHWSTLAGNATARLTGNASQPGYYQFQCNTCHAIGTHPTGASGLNFADVGFNITWATGNTGGNYAQGTGNTTDTRGQKISVNGSCTNIYCHSSGSAPSTLGGNSAPTYKTVAWSDTSTGCNFCHNAPPATNAHATHATTYSFGCAECHQATVSDNTTIADRSKHVNFINDLQWKSNGFNKGGDAYETAAANTCSNIYCHSQGRANVAPYNAANVVATWTSVGGLGTQCAGCHNGGTTMASGKHSNHVNNSATMGANFTCDKCHSATATNNTTVNVAAGNHVNKKVNVKFDNAINPDTDTPKYNNIATNVAGGAAVDPGSTGYACTNVYCHSQGNRSVAGNFNTVAWTDATWSATCNGCHGKSNGAGAPDYATGLAGSATANSHSKHAVTYTINCSECHWNTTQNGTTIVTGAATHINGSSSSDVVAGASGKSPSLAYTAGTKSCNNAYCHSIAQTATGGALTGALNEYKTVQWGASVNCGSCHVNMNTDATGTGSHKLHAGSTGSAQYACSYCHGVNYTAASADVATHVNKSINLSWTTNATGGSYSPKGNTFAAGSGAYGTCSNKCHGSGTPTWGSSTPNVTCEKCHGSASTNPFKDTAGRTDAGGLGGSKAGAHVAHLGTLNYSNPIACTECHSVPANVQDFSTHMNGATTFAWDTLARTGSLAPNYTGTNCTNVYCHGVKLPSGASGNGSDMAPAWTNVAYLNGVPNATGDCGKCHQAPPQTTSHQKSAGPPILYYALNECNGCHDHVNIDGSFNNKAKHINGIVDGGGCSGCHSYDVDYTAGGGYVAGVWTGGTWGKGAYRDGLTPGQGWGAHAKHINHIKTRIGYDNSLNPFKEAAFGTSYAANVCGTCHTNTASNHTTDNSSGRMINFGDGTYKYGGSTGFSFLFDPAAPTTNPPTYNGQWGTSSAAKPKTCSAVGCHFSTTPVWSSY